jgi:hypothetical protein
MKLMTTPECWRETLLGLIDEIEGATGWVCGDEAYDDIVGDLELRVIGRLEDRGVTVDRSYQQRVGSFAIVQDGTPDERAAFREILAEEVEASRESVRREAIESRDAAITREVIEKLEVEAGSAGDDEMVEICRRAAAGDERAIIEVARCISEAAAQG